MNAGTSMRVGDDVAQRMPIWAWALLALTVVFAFYLRTRDIEAFFIGPDDGSYLNSARIHLLQRGGNPVRWFGEEVEWVRYLAHYFKDETLTYQHSYVHQWATRYLYRFGFGALESLRFSIAITGTLTVVFVAWFFRALFPRRRDLALIGAALVAVTPLHVFYSRTGWGQVGFAAFYLVYATLLFRVLVVIPSDDRRALRRAGIGMLVTSLLAYGYQEGVAPFIVGSGLVVVVAPWIFAREGAASGVWNRRTWTYVWSAIPVGTCTLSIALFSPFAQKYWFNLKGRASMDSYWDLKRMTLQNLFVEQRPDLLLTWLVLVLAFVGVVLMWRAERALAKYLVATVIAGLLVFFPLFGDAWLLRAYMPIYLVVIVFAAFGLAAIAEFVGTRVARFAGVAVVGLAIGVLALVTWTSLFGAVTSPLFIQHLYAQGKFNGLDYRHVDAEILAYLREQRKPDERVVVFGEKSGQFRMFDIGIDAPENYLEGPRATWPTWVFGKISTFEARGFDVAHGGPYTRVMKDTIDRYALYRMNGL